MEHEISRGIDRPIRKAERAEDRLIAVPEHAVLLAGAAQESIVDLRRGDAIPVFALSADKGDGAVLHRVMPPPQRGEQTHLAAKVVDNAVVPVTKNPVLANPVARRRKLPGGESVVIATVLLAEVEAQPAIAKNVVQGGGLLGLHFELPVAAWREPRTVAAEVEEVHPKVPHMPQRVRKIGFRRQHQVGVPPADATEKRQ